MTRFRTFIPLISLLLTLVPALAWAELQGDSPTDAMLYASAARIDRLEAELADLRTAVGQTPEVAMPRCERPGGLIGGAALVLAKPHFKEAFEATTFDALTGTINLIPFEYEFKPSVRAWLGYVGPNGNGIRATYWDFGQKSQTLTLLSDAMTTQSAQVITVTIPASITTTGAGETLIANSTLNTRTLDLEGTISKQLGDIEVTAGGGLRYAALYQDFTGSIINGGVSTQQLTWKRTYEGLGPTLSAEFRKPIGCQGLALFGSGRGSLLFGKKSLSRFVNPAAGAQPPVPFARLNDADEVVPIFSLGLGAEWARQYKCGELSIRSAYEGQLWAEAGAPTLGFLGFECFTVEVGFSR